MTENDIDKAELAKILSDDISRADEFIDSEVQEQRDRAYQYYYGEPYEGDEKLKSRSKYISREVLDSVEAVKDLMLEAFTSGSSAVHFKPVTANDAMNAKVATRIAEDLFTHKNPGEQILEDTLHDALLSKLCVGKVVWEERTKREPVSFSDMSEMEFEALMADDELELIEAEYEEIVVPDAQGQPITQRIYSGEVARLIDASFAEIRLVAPENFLCDPDADSVDNAEFCGEWQIKSASDLIEMGFDEKLVRDLPSNDGSSEYKSEGRHQNDSTYQSGFSDDESSTPDRQKHKLYELYKLIDLDDDGVSELYQVYMVGNKVLSAEEVDAKPYRVWSPFRLSHRWLGMSLADVLTDIQKASSVMNRNIIDTQMFALYGRYISDVSGFQNPRDLVEPVPGQVLDHDRPQEAIWPFPTPDVPMSVFNTLETFSQDAESRSGTTRLSQGLDQRAMQGNVSGDTIARMTNAGNRRAMRFARSYARNWLAPIMMDLYEVTRRNDTRPMSVEVQGKFVQVVPKELDPRSEMEVKVALTPEESVNRAQALLGLHNTLLMDQGTAIYQDREKHAVMDQVYDLLGWKDASAFLRNPESPDYTDPKMEQMQQMLQQLQGQLQTMQQQLSDKSVDQQIKDMDAQTKRLKVMMDAQNKDEALDLEAQVKGDQQALDERQFSHKRQMDEKELELEARQNRGVTVG